MTGFVSMLKDINVSVEQLQTITKSGKVVEFNSHVYYKNKSLIHGQGVFAKKILRKEKL